MDTFADLKNFTARDWSDQPAREPREQEHRDALAAL
jgi:hypothetical protein